MNLHKMNIKGRNKISPDFNMSSMTDIVFLFWTVMSYGPKFYYLMITYYRLPRLKYKRKIIAGPERTTAPREISCAITFQLIIVLIVVKNFIL